MVRVLHIVTNMDRGGLETMLMNYYRHIDREKIQFDFLVHRRDRAAYDDEIESLGGRIFRLPRLNPLSSGYFHALNAFFAAHPEYRIVHSHLDCMSAYPLCAAKNAKVPVRIAHAHSTSQDRNWKLAFKLISKKMIAFYATDLFACSVSAGKWMFGTSNVRILPNAIDVNLYTFSPSVREQMRKELGVENRLVIGHVGRFSAVKNHMFLLDVFVSLLKKEPNAVLLLVGGGEDMPKIQAKAHALGIAEHVRFLGVRSDVADLMQAMDVFVFPSLYEGLPVTMIEAQASGLPCIISDGVPRDCVITDLVQQIDLNDDLSAWAEKAIAAAKLQRKDTHEVVCSAGFDIYKAAEHLERYYEQLEVRKSAYGKKDVFR